GDIEDGGGAADLADGKAIQLRVKQAERAAGIREPLLRHHSEYARKQGRGNTGAASGALAVFRGGGELGTAKIYRRIAADGVSLPSENASVRIADHRDIGRHAASNAQ